MATPRPDIQADLDRYCKAFIQPEGWRICLDIERRYGLDGYTPQIVTAALVAAANGEDMGNAIDALIAPDEAEDSTDGDR